jgi:pyruvate/2-oxoglutarate dehydrogenase complex dihydrolipoamide dehydrogenase (E3) component
MTRPGVFSPDEDPALVALVRPPGWTNPTSRADYDLVVIGGGAAGLVCAIGAAGLGGRVALVERHRLGGDCLNTGCVPSKALAAIARSAAGATPQQRLENARRLFRQRRAQLAPHDSASRLAGLGIDLFFGQAAFTGTYTIAVEGAKLRFKKAALCAGASPALPNIPGLADCQPLTTDSFFDLNRLPASLAIVGAGPVGVELAQSLARLGCSVTLVEQGERILPREDGDAVQVLEGALVENDGVRLHTDTAIQRAEKTDHGVRLHLQSSGTSLLMEAEAVLVATGRTPNTAGLDLGRAGIELDGLFPRVDRYLQTTNPRVYAAGDVTGPPYLTHRSGAHAKVVIQNALFWHPLSLGKARADRLVIPRCLHTDPAIAQVGLTPEEAEEAGIPSEVFTEPATDRARLEGETGYLRLVVAAGTDRLLGATVVGRHAGELIFPAVELLQTGRGLTSLSPLVLPYPTRMEIWTRAAQQMRAYQFKKSAWQQRLVRWLTGFGA